MSGKILLIMSTPISDDQAWEWVEQQTVLTIETVLNQGKLLTVVPYDESNRTPDSVNELQNDLDSWIEENVTEPLKTLKEDIDDMLCEVLQDIASDTQELNDISKDNLNNLKAYILQVFTEKLEGTFDYIEASFE